jgi:hypothetical protein
MRTHYGVAFRLDVVSLKNVKPIIRAGMVAMTTGHTVICQSRLGM